MMLMLLMPLMMLLMLTFTLQPLSEEAFEQLLAVLAHSGPRV